MQQRGMCEHRQGQDCPGWQRLGVQHKRHTLFQAGLAGCGGSLLLGASFLESCNTQRWHACFEPPYPCQIGGTACLTTMQLRNRPQLRTSAGASLLLAGFDSSPASGALSLPGSLPAAGCGFAGFSGSACCSEWVDTESLLGALLLLLLASLLL